MVIKINYTSSDVYVSTSVSPVYVVVNYSGTSGGGGGVWGQITGTLSDQTDLQDALDDKFDDPTGTTSQYLRGDGSLATFPTIPSGTVTSVGLTMPSAFNVANSPVTSSGTLAVTGAGTASQYVRGDGQLANFPDNGGGGSSVNYYLNGSVTQGTFGGDTYYEMSKTPILGAGTNFTRTNGQGNGYIASFITDAGDPSLLNIPGGNWNLEFYFQSSASGGNPEFYGELYKVSASNVFTLVASGSTNPEGITNGTTIDQYFTSIPVPQTSLLVTDRLAVRIYVITSGRTITLHTEDGNLCEVLTTLSTGLNALNGLTAQVQYFATGTSGTDFAISSATDTHTFNLPTASATNRGALSSADWTTFNGRVPSSRTLTINGTTQDLSADRTFTIPGLADGDKGDITVSGSGATWTIDNGVVGVAKLSATGTPSSTTYLRGDNTWATVTSGGTTIYTGDGTLTGNRVVTSGGFTLNIQPITSFSGNTIYVGTSTTRRLVLDNGTSGSVAPYIGAVVTGVYESYISFPNAIDIHFRVLPNSGNFLNIYTANVVSTGFIRSNGGSIIAGASAGNNNILFTRTGIDDIGIIGFPSTTKNFEIRVNGAYDFASGTLAAKFWATGNVTIGGTTDAGFRLDVNGTARVSGNVTLEGTTTANNILFIQSGNAIRGLGNFFIDGPGLGGTITYRAVTHSFPSGSLTNINDIQTGNITVNAGGNTSALITGPSGATSFRIQNTKSGGGIWYFENNRNAVAGSLEISNSIGLPGLTLFPSRSISLGTYTETLSAIFAIDSTTKGFRPPAMTTTQKNAIGSPVAGLQVYDTTLNQMSYYNGTTWINF
jgi:hypothetical protein